MRKFTAEGRLLIAMTCIFAILSGTLTGCGYVGKTKTPAANEPVTLTTIMTNIDNPDALTGGETGKIPVLAELEKRTGVHINSIVTSPDEYDTKLSLLIAAKDEPDIFTLPSNFPGGPAKAAEDGIIIRINQYWDKYAPNYKKVVTSRPDWEKSIKADNGDVYTFAFIKEEKSISVFFGPMLRKDLLDKAGLQVPETISEWYTVLTEFKRQGIAAPFTALNWFIGYSGAFTGAYGAAASLAAGADGKIHYGPIEPGFKDFLSTFKQWYKEGLIDPDYLTMKDPRILDAKMNSGKSAATLNFISKIDTYTDEGRRENPDFRFVAAKYPVLIKGEKPLYGQCDPPTKPRTCVSSRSRHIEKALEYLDYGYSPEGRILMNFGIEGISYTKDEKGNPVYTELIASASENSEGLTREQLLSMYCPAASEASTIQLKAYFDQLRLMEPSQKDAAKLWADTRIPSSLPNLSFTKEETLTVRKLTNIDAYVYEMTAKFLMGDESLDNFDRYVQYCRNMGIDEVLKVYNDALIRYNNR